FRIPVLLFAILWILANVSRAAELYSLPASSLEPWLKDTESPQQSSPADALEKRGVRLRQIAGVNEISCPPRVAGHYAVFINDHLMICFGPLGTGEADFKDATAANLVNTSVTQLKKTDGKRFAKAVGAIVYFDPAATDVDSAAAFEQLRAAAVARVHD